MLRDDPRAQLIDCELAIAVIKASLQVSEYEAWKLLIENVEKQKDAYLDLLASTHGIEDIREIQGAIKVLRRLKGWMKPDPKDLKRMESKAEGLRQTIKGMQDAGLFAKNPEETP